MNLFNVTGKSHVSGVMLPAAVLLTFSATLITLAYMDRMMDKKTDIEYRIAKAKARFNAESGVSITISGPTEGGTFVPSLGSSDWPSISGDGDVYEAAYEDMETFSGYHEPENPNTYFPNAPIGPTANIDMGEFYNIVLQTYQNEITRRPERRAYAHGRAKIKNMWGDNIYVVDSAEVRYTVEVLSDFMYLTHQCCFT